MNIRRSSYFPPAADKSYLCASGSLSYFNMETEPRYVSPARLPGILHNFDSIAVISTNIVKPLRILWILHHGCTVFSLFSQEKEGIL